MSSYRSKCNKAMLDGLVLWRYLTEKDCDRGGNDAHNPELMRSTLELIGSHCVDSHLHNTTCENIERIKTISRWIILTVHNCISFLVGTNVLLVLLSFWCYGLLLRAKKIVRLFAQLL